MANFRIAHNDRVFITGKTGSGKTFLVRHLLKNHSRLMVLDGKGSLTDWNLEPYNINSLRKLRSGERVRIRALPDRTENPQEFFRSALEAAYNAGNVTVYIDELYAVVPPNSQAPDILWSLYTRGREYNIGIWSSTQRPVWVPLVALSESEHFFMFRLSLDEDRTRLAGFLGKTVLTPIRAEHGFFYSRAEWDRPQFYTKLEV